MGTIPRRPFDRELQRINARRLAQVASERSLDVDARRLFVKTWVNLLDIQSSEGEREIGGDELMARYSGPSSRGPGSGVRALRQGIAVRHPQYGDGVIVATDLHRGVNVDFGYVAALGAVGGIGTS